LAACDTKAATAMSIAVPITRLHNFLIPGFMNHSPSRNDSKVEIYPEIPPWCFCFRAKHTPTLRCAQGQCAGQRTPLGRDNPESAQT
jgi:hypothetical protein